MDTALRLRLCSPPFFTEAVPFVEICVVLQETKSGEAAAKDAKKVQKKLRESALYCRPALSPSLDRRPGSVQCSGDTRSTRCSAPLRSAVACSLPGVSAGPPPRPTAAALPALPRALRAAGTIAPASPAEGSRRCGAAFHHLPPPFTAVPLLWRCLSSSSAAFHRSPAASRPQLTR